MKIVCSTCGGMTERRDGDEIQCVCGERVNIYVKDVISFGEFKSLAVYFQGRITEEFGVDLSEKGDVSTDDMSDE